MQPPKFGSGQAVRRKEDDALLRGVGHYVADHAPAGVLHAVVLRSPHAHARFRITDVAKARAMPGVALVLTGVDTAELGNLPCLAEVPGATIHVPAYPALAQGEVRHVGDAIAFVVAETENLASDAAEAIAIKWEAMPTVIGAEAALAPKAALVWNDAPGQSRLRNESGRQTRDGARFLGGSANGFAHRRQPAPRRQLSRYPRRDR